MYERQVCWEQVADLVVDTTEKSFEEIIQAICVVWERDRHGIL